MMPAIRIPQLDHHAGHRAIADRLEKYFPMNPIAVAQKWAEDVDARYQHVVEILEHRRQERAS